MRLDDSLGLPQFFDLDPPNQLFADNLKQHGQKKQEIFCEMDSVDHGIAISLRDTIRYDTMLHPTRTVLYDKFTHVSRIKRHANTARNIGLVFSFSLSPETLA
jgi:hypothetical protein